MTRPAPRVAVVGLLARREPRAAGPGPLGRAPAPGPAGRGGGVAAAGPGGLRGRAGAARSTGSTRHTSSATSASPTATARACARSSTRRDASCGRARIREWDEAITAPYGGYAERGRVLRALERGPLRGEPRPPRPDPLRPGRSAGPRGVRGALAAAGLGDGRARDHEDGRPRRLRGPDRARPDGSGPRSGPCASWPATTRQPRPQDRL